MSYFLKRGFALIEDKNSKDNHFFGGAPYHKNAICPVCDIPFLLLVDIDCKALSVNGGSTIGEYYDRLPLYYCWRCSARSLGYKIHSSNEIEVFQNYGSKQPEGFPYPSYPVEFEKRRLRAQTIPYNISKILFIAQELGRDWLEDNDQKLLGEYLIKFRHSGFLQNYLNRHQFGGVINQFNGHMEVGCPNKNCSRHSRYLDGAACFMQELAAIHNDPSSGLPMVDKKLEGFNEWVQVVFWICEECLSIVANNRTD